MVRCVLIFDSRRLVLLPFSGTVPKFLFWFKRLTLWIILACMPDELRVRVAFSGSLCFLLFGVRHDQSVCVTYRLHGVFQP